KPTNEKEEVQIPLSSALEVHLKFSLCFYGYFVGKRVAFLVVENYVRNSWKKYGIVRVMMNARGFFFEFSSVELVTKLGSMCLQSWGRLDYVRVLIDIRADQEFKDEMIVSITNVEDDGECWRNIN
nr:hypothetical protein [Tanacetum cinerariifolium]